MLPPQGEDWRWRIQRVERSGEASVRVHARRLRKGFGDYGVYLCEIGTRNRVLGRVLIAGSHPFAVKRWTLNFFADSRYEQHLRPNLYLRVCQDDHELEYPYAYRGEPPGGLSERVRDWLAVGLPDSLPAIEPPQMKGGVITLETYPR